MMGVVAHGRLAGHALALWVDIHTARKAHVTRQTGVHCDALTRIDDMGRLLAPASFHRARRAALASLTGTMGGKARGARDVPAGTCWALPGLPLAAFPHGLHPETDPPPAAA